MSGPPPRLIAALLQGALLALMLVLGAQLVGVWAARLSYPYDLEWMEGGMLVHAWRLLEGRPVHTPPTPEWIPFLYPTGYPAVVAALGAVFGLSMGLARAVSLVGTLAAASAIPFLTARAGRGVWPGVVGAVVFLGTYRASGAFMDLVRLDGLMIGLIAWSVALAADGRRGTAPASALLLCGAYLVKHSAAVFGLPLALAIAHRDGRAAGLRFAAWSGLPALAITAAQQWASGGATLRYLIGVPASHEMVWSRAFPGTGLDYGWAIPLVGPLAAGALLAAAARGAPEARRRLALWGALVCVILALAGGILVPGQRGLPPKTWWTLAGGQATALLGAWAAALVLSRALRPASWRLTLALGVALAAAAIGGWMRVHTGGFANVLMPVHWAAAVGGAVALGRVGPAVRDGLGAGRVALASALLVGQLGWSLRQLDPAALVPTEADRAAGDALVARLAAVPPPALSPLNPWLLVLAGHEEPGFHLIALWDVDHEGGPFHEDVAAIEAAFAAGRWTAILDGPRAVGFGSEAAYDRGERWIDAPAVLLPKTGWPTRPDRLRRRLRVPATPAPASTPPPPADSAPP